MINTARYTRFRSRRASNRLVSIIMFLLVAGGLTQYRAQDSTAATGQDIEVDIRGVKLKIPDVVLRDQEGRKVRFYSDLIKDKIVVLSFFYTNCSYTCTLQGRTFSKLQTLLGERLGTSVFLISVTTDPRKDNSAELKAWGKRYDIESGWTLVTGDEPEMNKLLIQFTGSKGVGGMHLPATFIANDRTGFWTGVVGVFAPEHLLEMVNAVAQPQTTVR